MILKLSLIFNLAKYQVKEHLVQLKNVKVNLINNIMQLNEQNNKKGIQILKRYKLVNKFKMNRIL